MNEKQKLGTEPAFAQPLSNDGHGNLYSSNDKSYVDAGMSKRFYAACAAMQGLLSNSFVNTVLNPDSRVQNAEIVTKAYAIADELLKQENQ